MEKLAAACAANNDPVRAVYILSWSQAASSDTSPSTDQRLTLQKASQLVPEAMLAEIMAKKTGHSLADMQTYVARAPAPPPMVAAKPVASADISKIQPATATSKTMTSEVLFKSGVIAQLMDSPAGVIYHPDRRTLEWTPPPFSRTPEAKVLFLLKNPDGGEESYVHTISRK